MENSNTPNPQNRGTRKNSEDELSKEKDAQLEPKPEKGKEESAFLKSLKKVGYSVWLGVMIIGAGLAFIASILLL